MGTGTILLLAAGVPVSAVAREVGRGRPEADFDATLRGLPATAAAQALMRFGHEPNMSALASVPDELFDAITTGLRNAARQLKPMPLK